MLSYKIIASSFRLSCHTRKPSQTHTPNTHTDTHTSHTQTTTHTIDTDKHRDTPSHQQRHTHTQKYHALHTQTTHTHTHTQKHRKTRTCTHIHTQSHINTQHTPTHTRTHTHTHNYRTHRKVKMSAFHICRHHEKGATLMSICNPGKDEMAIISHKILAKKIILKGLQNFLATDVLFSL